MQDPQRPDQRIPETWVGERIVVFGSGTNPTYGELFGLSEFGIAVRQWSYVQWPVGESEWGMQYDGNQRVVVEFYPWHSINGFRLQEKEETKAYPLI